MCGAEESKDVLHPSRLAKALCNSAAREFVSRRTCHGSRLHSSYLSHLKAARHTRVPYNCLAQVLASYRPGRLRYVCQCSFYLDFNCTMCHDWCHHCCPCSDSVLDILLPVCLARKSWCRLLSCHVDMCGTRPPLVGGGRDVVLRPMRRRVPTPRYAALSS